MFSFPRELRTNRAYLYLIKSAIFSILVSRNKWLVVVVGGWKLVIWSAFSWSFKRFLEYWLPWFWPHILQAYIKWELKIKKYIVLRRCLGTLCLIFDSRPTLRLSFFPRFYKYLFQCKCSCSITPKYLTWFVGLIFLPLSRKLRCLVIVLFLGLNIIILVFLAFKESLFALAHSTISFRSLLTFLFNCLSDFSTTRRFVSSANWWTERY